jgi:ABC-type multidrug transport system ATPase subunit
MPEAALKVRGLSRSFGQRFAVKELNLNVNPGDVYGFLGPNGAGKTTAIRCILGIIRRDCGEVSIFGESNLTQARAQVGAIVETPCFHGWMSGRANLNQAAAYLNLGSAESKREIDRVLERVGLTERAKDRSAQYSLGMKQRLGIARALLGKPKLLILDEPTNGLDPRGMREMRELIQSLAIHDGITIFVSSHLLAEVQAICNRVGIIQQGVLRKEGEVSEFLKVESAADDTGVTLEIGSPTPDTLKAALAERDDVTILGPGNSGRLQIRYTGDDVAALNRALVLADIPIDSLISAERNLEDVFMEVTA